MSLAAVRRLAAWGLLTLTALLAVVLIASLYREWRIPIGASRVVSTRHGHFQVSQYDDPRTDELGAYRDAPPDVEKYLQLLQALSFVPQTSWLVERWFWQPTWHRRIYVGVSPVGGSELEIPALDGASAWFAGAEQGAWCVENRYTVSMAPPFLICMAATLAVWPRIIIRAVRTAKRRRLGLCLACGYNLTGNVSGRCPECGEHIEAVK